MPGSFLIEDAALVTLGSGPYARTSRPVIEACLDARVPYLDINDDVDSTRAALDHHARAKKAGIALYIGCGASPGATNVFVRDAARDLDTVGNIDVCWAVGDERPGIDRAPAESRDGTVPPPQRP
ncbi:hypothetical protein ACIQ6Y_20325 [Streptomyces sp. NPDC096205]|uniref:hypothetical protein n=1 Tax=Streptomyces sp. NPDC096205 TaxID=3366081 RepID=UPI0037F86E24